MGTFPRKVSTSLGSLEKQRKRKVFMERCPRRWRGAPTDEKVSPSDVRVPARNAGATGARIANCTRTLLRIFPTWARFRSQRRGHVRRFVSAQSGEPRQVKVKWVRTSLFFFFLPRTRPTWTPFRASKRCPRGSRHCTDVVEDGRGNENNLWKGAHVAGVARRTGAAEAPPSALRTARIPAC